MTVDPDAKRGFSGCEERDKKELGALNSHTMAARGLKNHEIARLAARVGLPQHLSETRKSFFCGSAEPLKAGSLYLGAASQMSQG